jgi:Flp pilus assembly protein TadD
MGFLGGLFQKKQTNDPLQLLRDKVDENPKDPKLANDLAMQLKAKGDVESAVHYALIAATAHAEQGFLQRALAVLRAAEAWGKPTPELLGALVDTHLQLKHKEDARGALIKLRALHSAAGNRGELPKIDARLAELGPGR